MKKLTLNKVDEVNNEIFYEITNMKSIRKVKVICSLIYNKENNDYAIFFNEENYNSKYLLEVSYIVEYLKKYYKTNKDDT